MVWLRSHVRTAQVAFKSYGKHGAALTPATSSSNHEDGLGVQVGYRSPHCRQSATLKGCGGLLPCRSLRRSLPGARTRFQTSTQRFVSSLRMSLRLSTSSTVRPDANAWLVSSPENGKPKARIRAPSQRTAYCVSAKRRAYALWLRVYTIADAMRTSLDHQFTHPAFSNYRLRVTSPKICDPTVKQYSGYLDISDTRHLFFW